jgi:hypothetical protein
VESWLGASKERENEDDKEDQAEATARIITPARAVGPGGEGAEKQENEEND